MSCDLQKSFTFAEICGKIEKQGNDSGQIFIVIMKVLNNYHVRKEADLWQRTKKSRPMQCVSWRQRRYHSPHIPMNVKSLLMESRYARITT